MGYQETSRYCSHCEEYTLARRPGTSHVLHLLLTVVTGCLWLPIWFLCSIKIGGWRCSRCGSRV